MWSMNPSRLVALGALLACQEPSAVVQSGEPDPDPSGAVAYLVAEPGFGDTVTVRVRARTGIDAGMVGSFSLRIAFDARVTRFLAVLPLEGGLRVHNAQPGVVRVAGAAAEGFATSDLFAARFLSSGDPEHAFTLEVPELVASGSFRDLVPVLHVMRSPLATGDVTVSVP